ncbi:hypothetical protein BJP27_19125 [Pseudomonas oryzihabitans]|nr:hypothetical protein BJP27_19125 [Pseudomonas psychrotolerans]
MDQAQDSSFVRKPLKTQLAKPYHYRRDGVYYLRVRPVGSKASCTISLRTTDRSIAMATSRHLQSTLRTFHLDNPEATWAELRTHLREIAAGALEAPNEWELLDVMGLVYSDLEKDLRQIATTYSLTLDQARMVQQARRVMVAAEQRTHGDLGPLIGIIDELDRDQRDAEARVNPSLSVGTSEPAPPLTFRALADLYLVEHGQNVKASTARQVRSDCSALAEVLGALDLKTHMRSDLVAARDDLLEARLPSTVNKLLARLSTVLEWGVNNGHLERSFDKKLKLTKGAKSSREAFTQDQVAKLMDHASSLSADRWERWALSLGCITGARIGEIHQLRKEDIKQVGEVWSVDINEGEGKSLKNEQSSRLVPLAVGAYGFDLSAFLGYVQALPEGAALFSLSRGRFSEILNETLREVLGIPADRVLTFHSLRHSLASLMKSKGVPLESAQPILGHSSQSITYDTYGAGAQVEVERLSQVFDHIFSHVEAK